LGVIVAERGGSRLFTDVRDVPSQTIVDKTLGRLTGESA
jgi:hypothetical protein